MLRTACRLAPGARKSSVQRFVRSKSTVGAGKNVNFITETEAREVQESSLAELSSTSYSRPLRTNANIYYEQRQSKKGSKFENNLSRQSNIRPAVLSSRVTELLDRNEVDEAIALVQDAKKGSTNTITWNTLLKGLMDRKKRNTAFKVFNNMKKRGFKPNQRTYFIMMHGYWEGRKTVASAWETAGSLYEEYLELLRNTPEGTFNRPELRHVSTLHYFDLLGAAGQFEKMFDVYYQLMEETGLLTPDTYVYYGLLKNLKLRTETEKLGTLTINEQNAADAKDIWRRLEKSVERDKIEIDSYTIKAVLDLLVLGRAQDHNFAFDVVRTHLGLSLPGDSTSEPLSITRTKFELNSYLLQPVLELCNRAGKPRVAWAFIKKVAAQGLFLDDRLITQSMFALEATARATAEAGAGAVAAEEPERAIELLRISINQDKNPGAYKNAIKGTFGLPHPANKFSVALIICAHCHDWANACAVFALATNIPAERFLDGQQVEPISDSPPPTEETSTWKNVNLQALTFLARTAIATDSDAHIRQCLRMLATKGAAISAYDAYYEAELAKLIVRMVKRVLSSGSEEDKVQWERLSSLSREVLKNSQKVWKIPSLERKITPLGSIEYLEKVDKSVEFDMAVRSRHSIA